MLAIIFPVDAMNVDIIELVSHLAHAVVVDIFTLGGGTPIVGGFKFDSIFLA